MKRLVMAAAALAVSFSMSFAQKPETRKEPFAINLDKLSTYLELAPTQKNQVASINEQFAQAQNDNMHVRMPGNEKDKQVRQMLTDNLQSMKGVLTSEQYRKYVTLINVTYNNNRILTQELRENRFLAEGGRMNRVR